MRSFFAARCDRLPAPGILLAYPSCMSHPSDAFLAALRPHYDDALRYSRALCARWSPDQAEDVFQSALLRALERFGDLRDPSQFRSWFFRILTRTFYQSVRRRKIRSFLPLPGETESAALGLFDPSSEPGEMADLLAVLSMLSDKERAALLLFEVAGFSVAEVAEIQGDRSASAVKSRLSRARLRARHVASRLGLEPGGDAPSPLPLVL